MNEKETREAYFELKVIEQQMQQLQQQLEQIVQNISEFELSIKSLDELKGKSGEETFVPLSGGIYAKAKLQDTDKLIVNVGAGVAVEKSFEQTKEIIEKQLIEMKGYKDQMSKGLQLLSSRAQEIEEMALEAQNVQVS